MTAVGDGVQAVGNSCVKWCSDERDFTNSQELLGDGVIGSSSTACSVPVDGQKVSNFVLLACTVRVWVHYLLGLVPYRR